MLLAYLYFKTQLVYLDFKAAASLGNNPWSIYQENAAYEHITAPAYELLRHLSV